MHEVSVERFGEAYPFTIIDPTRLKNYFQLGDDFRFSFREFFAWHYLDYAVIQYGYSVLFVDLFLPAFFLLLGFVFLIWFWIWKPRPGIIFDREKQAVYTWQNGRLYAERWRNLEIRSDPLRPLSVTLHPETPTHKDDWVNFPLHAQDFSAIFSGQLSKVIPSRRSVIEELTAYMGNRLNPTPHFEGKLATWSIPSLRGDPEPKRLDYRLARLLEDIDSLT